MEQLGDLVVFLERVPEMQMLGNGVVVAPSPPFPAEIAVEFQVHHDLHGGPFGDADEVGDLAQAEVRCLGHGQEHVGVVGEEGPATRRRLVAGVRHEVESSPICAKILDIQNMC